MKIAYLVLAHNNPRHLQRLVRALSSGSAGFFIHVDRKSSMGQFSGTSGENVHFTRKRIPVHWGEFSQVDAILVLLRAALAHPRGFDYFVLLSATDYPIQPVAYIERFFERHRGEEFINMVRMPCEAAGKPISRLTTYQPFPGGSLVARGMRKLLASTGTGPRQRAYEPHLRNLVPHGGSTWWALSREACEHIRSFVDNEPRVVKFFRHTLFPDESFFQTILGNSPYKARVRRNLTYTDWDAGGGSPAFMTQAHLDFLTAGASVALDGVYGEGEALFARKFSDEAEALVVRLDRVISEREKALGHS